MYIQPDGIIYVLNNVPLDPTYDHTIFLQTKAKQEEYFISKRKYSFTNQTYQRVNKGTMRVERKADLLYDCNYLMFKNQAYGDKWFYAFILSVEYINDLVSEITYEIDVLQTWLYDYHQEWCFIERQHSATDEPGDNLVPEGLETGEYVGSDWTKSNFCTGDNLRIVVAATFDDEYNDHYGEYTSGLYSGLNYHLFYNSPTGARACEDFIRGAGSKTDGIVAVFLCPEYFIQTGYAPSRYVIQLGHRPDNIGGYVPRNKKLLTYPYTFIYVTNLQGNHAEYHYEYFYAPTDCKGVYYGCGTPTPSVIMMPTNYKGFDGENPDEKLVLSGFPQLAFATDSYRAWLAQNASSLAINAMSSAIAGATHGAITGETGVAGATTGLLTGAFNAVHQMYLHSIMPDQAHTGGGQETLAAARYLEYYFCNKHITPQFARIIDSYFDRFGYATNRLGIPNRTARKEWCYTKTIGCTLTGNIPGDDMRKICSIYDAGITFWKHPENVGDYSLDNSPYASW